MELTNLIFVVGVANIKYKQVDVHLFCFILRGRKVYNVPTEVQSHEFAMGIRMYAYLVSRFASTTC